MNNLCNKCFKNISFSQVNNIKQYFTLFFSENVYFYTIAVSKQPVSNILLYFLINFIFGIHYIGN